MTTADEVQLKLNSPIVFRLTTDPKSNLIQFEVLAVVFHLFEGVKSITLSSANSVDASVDEVMVAASQVSKLYVILMLASGILFSCYERGGIEIPELYKIVWPPSESRCKISTIFSSNSPERDSIPALSRAWKLFVT